MYNTYSTIQVKTTAVFDVPNRAEPIQHNGFIVHSRYFGRVAAFVPFNDAIPGVPYEVFVERLFMHSKGRSRWEREEGGTERGSSVCRI